MSRAARAWPDVDVVVVGSGASGLRVAKTPALRGGSSPVARGGIAAAVGPGDSPRRHARDTIAAAAGLTDPAAVRALTEGGPRTIDRLIELGVRFDHEPGGGLALATEAAHSCPRVLHSTDATGEEVMRVLVAAARGASHITVRAPCFAESLVFEHGRVAGVFAQAGDGAMELHRARAVVLATGGIGHVFEATTNPREATGDGIALAARAGAALTDLEFVQFHPTALDTDADPRPLLSEALRGAGARFTGAGGGRETFPGGVPAELASRDVVSAWLAARAALGIRTYLDMSPIGWECLRRRFPGAHAICLAAAPGAPLPPVPIAPAAHFHMGGVATDRRGRTSLSGLWACGEVARTGAHGANRLASNSLLEALVFGAVVARDLRRTLGEARAPLRAEADRDLAPAGGTPPWVASAGSEAPLRAAVSDSLGVLRDPEGVAALIRALPSLVPADASGELANMALVARLIAGAALARKESLGAHRWGHSAFLS